MASTDNSSSYLYQHYSDGSTRIFEGGADRLTVKTDGNVGIGTMAPVCKLDVAYGGTCLNIGADNGTSTRTANTNKYGHISAAHWDITEEPMCIVGSNSIGGMSGTVYIGGGISTLNAANHVMFYVASDDTTLNGTSHLDIGYGSVHVNIGAADIDFKWNNANGGIGLQCDAGMRSGLGTVGIGMAPGGLYDYDTVLSVYGPTNTIQIRDVVAGISLYATPSYFWKVAINSGSACYYIPIYYIA
jgi:hypothetical protein